MTGYVVNSERYNPIVVQRSESHGLPGLDIRANYKLKGEEGKLRPTKKGVRVPDEDLAEFFTAVFRVVAGWDTETLEAIGSALEEVSSSWDAAETWRMLTTIPEPLEEAK